LNGSRGREKWSSEGGRERGGEGNGFKGVRRRKFECSGGVMGEGVERIVVKVDKKGVG
jgi:hypothetical protein